MTWPLVQFFLLSLLLVGAFAAAMRLIAPRLKVRGRHLEVIEATSLGGGKSLALVRVGDKTLLFAVTPKEVSLVSETAIEPQPAGGDAGPSPLEAWRERLGGGDFKALAERLRRLCRLGG